MGLQTEEPEAIGYIAKNKVLQHQKKMRELAEFEVKEAMKAGASKEDADLVEQLRKQNVSQDIIMELTRSKVNPKKGSPEILDLDVLMSLDQNDLTSQAEVNRKEKTLQEIERKPNNLICNRCFHLKHLHERLDY